ncbi:LysR family transcriptional regulator [Citrobacter sp. Awk 4]|uniref:LysR family transcriptional regulator n=1 Tax=Citrobacter sp. Awk 4 TaxID=2963955 RepID=UPI002302DC62|nr:LysR family transcriptional regulator [Citrobacter sp. Awk 4]MDA8481384.1 LysR family transcriptional regulator [Citrobacter sp. Awk 4]
MKDNLSIRELEIILDIVNTKSLSHTARNMGIAQANISRMIIKLEDRFGLNIFERSSRPIELTTFGKELIPYIKSHINTHAEIAFFVENYKNKLTGFVRLHAPVGQLYFISKYIVPVIAKEHPEIKLDIYTSNLREEDYLKGVRFDHECDIMFTYALPQNSSLIAFKLVEVQCNIYGTQSFLNNHPVSLPTQYSLYPCVLFHSFMQNGTNTWTLHDIRNNKNQQINVHGNIVCDNVYTAIELAKSDLGFIFIPNIIVSELGLNDKLLPTLPQDYSASVFTYIIYKKRKHQPQRVSIVIDIITDVIKNIIKSDWI